MAARLVTVDRLRFFIKNGVNVILTGRHGTGKTSMVRQAFIEEGLKFRMYSAATMDPWVDFIGVPRAVPNGGGKMSRGCDHQINPNQSLPMCLECGAPLFVPESDEMVLKLARPAEWVHDDVEAIFFDEFNRSHKKTRNAVMELCQFKSINDRPFPNLKVVWAAVNPADDEDLEYDVEVIDPAQEDRFHVHLSLPYKPSRNYFRNKFGAEIADVAISWWNALPDKENPSPEGLNIKNMVSPRRLDYALDIWQITDGGHLEDVLPFEANIAALRNALNVTPVKEALRKFFTELKEAREAITKNIKPKRDIEVVEEEVEVFLADENNYVLVQKEIVSKPAFISVFIPLMPEEKISDLICNEKLVRSHFLRKYDESDIVREVMENIASSGTNTAVSREITRVLRRARLDRIKGISPDATPNPDRHDNFFMFPTNPNFSSVLQTVASQKTEDTYARNGAYDRIQSQIPAEMSVADAVACLTQLDILIKHSHGKTIRGWTDLIGVINNCIENLIKAKWDFTQFTQKFEKLAGYVINVTGFYFEVV